MSKKDQALDAAIAAIYNRRRAERLQEFGEGSKAAVKRAHQAENMARFNLECAEVEEAALAARFEGQVIMAMAEMRKRGFAFIEGRA
jgi:hypothetical protein